MHASRIRASLLLLSAVACFGVRPSVASEADAWLERIQVADGGSHYQTVAGTAEATLTVTSGMVMMLPSSSMPLAAFTRPEPPYRGEIRVKVGSIEDYGETDNVSSSAFMSDPAMTTVRLTFVVPSLRFPGTTLHADITITAMQPFEADPEIPNVRSNGGGIQITGPAALASRYGRVSGRIWSDRLGPSAPDRTLRPYGPAASTNDSMAVVTDQIVDNAYVKP